MAAIAESWGMSRDEIMRRTDEGDVEIVEVELPVEGGENRKLSAVTLIRRNV